MRTIIAGGRDYQLTVTDLDRLDEVGVTTVISGGCSGVDKCGETWAKYNDIPIEVFPADWKQYGRSAGPKRNQQMAEHADAVVLFPGGKGTESMFKIATKMKLKIYDFRKPMTIQTRMDERIFRNV